MSQNTDGQTVMVQGRIVWVSGDLFAGKVKTEFGTNVPKLNKQGEQMKEYGFGLAVPKDAFASVQPGEPGHIWEAMHAEAHKLYPGGQLPPSFSMKYKDGDGVDHNGQSFSSREGYANHLVFSLTTSLPIQFFKWENGQNIQVNSGIKCGDYVKVQVQVKAHGAIGQGKPGLYLNPMAVQFLGFGKEIINTPSGDQIFGMSAPSAPAGASATPVDPAPGAQIVPNAAPQPAAAPAPMPAAAPVPHHGVLPQNLQPQAAAPTPQAAAPTPQAAAPVPGVPTFPTPQG